ADIRRVDRNRPWPPDDEQHQDCLAVAGVLIAPAAVSRDMDCLDLFLAQPEVRAMPVANLARDVPQVLDGVADLRSCLPLVGPQAMHGPRQQDQHGSRDKREILSHPWSLLLQPQLLLHTAPTATAPSVRSESWPIRADPDRLPLCSSLSATECSG